MGPSQKPPGGERILVRSVNWLGDSVMAMPALLRLREARPDAHIALLTHERLADLWRAHPAVDSILTFASGDGVFPVAKRLRGEAFDLGIAFPNSARAAFELWLGGVPIRVGYAGGLRRLLLTRSVTAPGGVKGMRKKSTDEIQRLIQSPGSPVDHGGYQLSDHHIHHYLRLVEVLGANPAPLPPLISVTQEECREVAARLGLSPALNQGKPLFGLNPGAQYGMTKRWPPERYIAAAIEIQRRTGCVWVVVGGEIDAALAGRIAAEIQAAGNAVNLAGATKLRDLCAVFNLCRVVLTNDSGPMHVAAAVGVPVVVPFGSTSPELTGPGVPGDRRHRCLSAGAACSPCFLRECPVDFRCMNGIGVEAVVAAVIDAASGPPLVA
jgi:heptosyltransferase-2